MLVKRAASVTLMVALASACAVVAVGWYSDVRGLMHAALIAVSLFALLPFVVIAALLGLICSALIAMALIVAVSGGDAHTDHVDLPIDRLFSGRWLRAYYGFLARHSRSPWFGFPLGALLGGLALWAIIALVIVPREVETTRLLQRAQAQIERGYAADRRYPAREVLAQQGALLDGFGRPMQYEVKGRLLLQSYRLLSVGADGVPSDDDLCVEGRTRLQSALDVLSALASREQLLRDERASFGERIRAIHAARCHAHDTNRDATPR